MEGNTRETRQPNPKRVAAGRLNQQKSRGMTAEGRERVREAAHRHQPWRFATGPKTQQGKTKVAQNGKSRQKGPYSKRQLREEMAEYQNLIKEMREARNMAL